MALGTILVVEDDDAIRRGVADTVRAGGYRALEAADGRAGLDTALTATVDLVLLDILMPKLDGIAVLREIRVAKPGLPVIMLTAKGEEQDRVRGLRTGADDYMVKPFGAAELLARVEAVLRRSAERPTTLTTMKVNGMTIDFERREIARSDGSRSVLPQREAEVLMYLASNPGRAVSRDELLSRVWGIDPRGVHTRTVDMAIARLREQMGDDPMTPTVVVTVRGKGYMLAVAAENSGQGA